MGGTNVFFDALLHAVNDAVTIVDAEGIVLHWNEVAEQTYGIAQAEIAGKRIGEFFRRESVMLFQVMESGEAVRHVYHEPKPGMHVMITAVPVFGEDGALAGAISIEQNISSYVKLSAEMHSKPNGDAAYPSSLPAYWRVDGDARALAGLAYPLLLYGEEGVGKRTLAEWLHRAGARADTFVAVSCGSVPGGLVEAELFGYQAEPFGAAAGGPAGNGGSGRPGKLDQAGGGSVYLKDVHALPLPAQEKLAQALQAGRFRRVGGSADVPLACRVFASAPPDAETLVREGALLAQLYYAFQVQRVPALRERKQDLPELCRLFLAEAAEMTGKPVPALGADAVTALAAYDWPGNLPQLRNAMQRMMIAAQGGELTAGDLPQAIRLTTLNELTEHSLPLNVHAGEVERTRIAEALELSRGNKAKAARLLGISRGALYYKLKQYGLE